MKWNSRRIRRFGESRRRPSDRSLQQNETDTFSILHRLQDQVISSQPPMPPGGGAGKGIVMAAGGARYFTCAWVCLTILRDVLQCTLPIQLWYLGRQEMSEQMIDLLRPFDLECVDASTIGDRLPPGGWQLKPYAILHCPFREVVYLDADNVPLLDPAVLLSRDEYLSAGAAFWPDIQRLAPNNPIWQLCRVAYRDEPEFETGQLVIDKTRCWTALQLTMHMNYLSDIYYRYILGDKETFHLAWRMLEQPFAMPSHLPLAHVGRIEPEDGKDEVTLLQRDFDGSTIFCHRTGGPAKWTAWGKNLNIPGVPFEDTCFQALEVLRSKWDGRVSPFPIQAPGCRPSEHDLLHSRYFRYCRIGSDERVLEFLPGGAIGIGAGDNECAWRLESDDVHPILVLQCRRRTTCRLTYDTDGVWRGHWVHHERMPVEIIPTTPDEPTTGHFPA